jgi:hypothetical protein
MDVLVDGMPHLEDSESKQWYVWSGHWIVGVSASLELSCFLVELPARSGRILDHPFHRETILKSLAYLYVRKQDANGRYGSSHSVCTSWLLYHWEVDLDSFNAVSSCSINLDVVAIHDVAK